jgi:hypothetical protein
MSPAREGKSSEEERGKQLDNEMSQQKHCSNDKQGHHEKTPEISRYLMFAFCFMA